MFICIFKHAYLHREDEVGLAAMMQGVIKLLRLKEGRAPLLFGVGLPPLFLLGLSLLTLLQLQFLLQKFLFLLANVALVLLATLLWRK